MGFQDILKRRPGQGDVAGERDAAACAVVVGVAGANYFAERGVEREIARQATWRAIAWREAGGRWKTGLQLGEES
ncbi:MAG: hypothetical protein V3S27_00465 [Kiloniellales bacterium]